MSKVIYTFGAGKAEGDASMAALLGGKGAGVAEMSKLGINVPPGFTVPTTYCVEYMQSSESASKVMEEVLPVVLEGYNALKLSLGVEHPLVSVRSGAAISLPGMMDTILNVGMTTEALPYWSDKIGGRAACDCRRRLIQMMGATAYGIDGAKFEALLTQARFLAKVREDSDLSHDDLAALCDKYEDLFQAETGHPFPNTVETQLRAAVEAVFKSWNNERAITYRDINKIDHKIGTAVTVQLMVFGNLNDNSGSGVMFTRHPSTGKFEMMGEFLANAQGEDVVAGIRTPMSLGEAAEKFPAMVHDLAHLSLKLESHYKDMMDVEFTLQDGVLYVLQCRAGKRSPLAKLVIAMQFLKSGVIDLETVKKRLSRDDIRSILRPQIDPKFKVEPDFVGIGATVGVAVGRVVLTAAEAVAAKDPVILVREETDPDDIGGMNAAKGILTKTGGATSHAAVVARAMDKPCVVGCSTLSNMELLAGKTITLDGLTGRVWVDVSVPVIDASQCIDLLTLGVEIAKKTGQMIELDQETWVQLGNSLDGVPRMVKAKISTNFTMGVWTDGTLVDLRPEGTLPDDADGLTALFNAAPKEVDFAWGGTGFYSGWSDNYGVTFLASAEQKAALSQKGAIKFHGGPADLLSSLDAKFVAKIIQAAKSKGASVEAVNNALKNVPVPVSLDVVAASPAYIVMAAIQEG
jgi:pyruvate,orthophosphate dikinase